jgi:hypothetical protein
MPRCGVSACVVLLLLLLGLVLVFGVMVVVVREAGAVVVMEIAGMVAAGVECMGQVVGEDWLALDPEEAPLSLAEVSEAL